MSLATFAFILAGVLLNAVAQLLLKAGANAMGAIHLTAGNLLPTILKAGMQLPILGGLACYGISVFVWIVGLSRADVTVAYPMLSMGYVVAAVGAALFLHEALSPQRLLAIGVIILGVVLLARS